MVADSLLQCAIEAYLMSSQKRVGPLQKGLVYRKSKKLSALVKLAKNLPSEANSLKYKKKQKKKNIKLSFSGSNIFATMEICSKHG